MIRIDRKYTWQGTRVSVASHIHEVYIKLPYFEELQIYMPQDIAFDGGIEYCAVEKDWVSTERCYPSYKCV